VTARSESVVDAVNRARNERRVGAALGLAGVFAGCFASLLLTPIMLGYLEKSQFGLYQLIGAVAGYFTLMDFGISGTLTRYIAKYRAEEDQTRQENLFSMCMVIYIGIGLLLLAAGYAVYQNLARIFADSLTTEELAQARIMFVIVLGSAFLTILGHAYTGAINGCERFVFSRVVSIAAMLLRIGIVTSILAFGRQAVGVVCGEAALSALILAMNFLYARFVLKIRFKIHRWDWSVFAEIWSYALWIFLATVVLQINFRLGRVLLGIMTTTGLVAVYAIAMQINTLYNSLPTAISHVFLPKATRMVVGEASGAELTRFMIGPSRYQLMILGGLLSGFLLLGRTFITLWAGPEYIEAWRVAILVLIPVSIPLVQNTAVVILQAKGIVRTRSLINLGLAAANACLSVFFIRAYGVLGPAIGTALVLALGHGVILNLYYHYVVGLDMVVFFRETCRSILPAIGVALSLGVALTYWPMKGTWLTLTVQGLLYSAIYASVMWLYGMNAGERAFFKSAIRDCTRLVSGCKKTVLSQ